MCASVRKDRSRTKQERRVDMLDKLLAEIDPTLLLAMMLGGIATAGGLTPPLTRLLKAISEDIDLDVNTQQAAAATAAIAYPFPGIIGFVTSLFFPTGEPGSEEQKAEVAKSALVASGMIEVYIMTAMMRNPEIITTAIKAPAEILKGIGEIVPG